MENKLQKASLSELQIVNRAGTGLKIEYCKPNSISDSILTCCALIGLEAKPSVLEAKVLMECMIEFLRRYTLEEMELAFKIMVQNKIEKVEPYGKFSPSFLQDVMDNYKFYRDRLTGVENRKELEPTEPVRDIDYKDCYEFIDNYCQRDNKIPFGANWSQAYDYARREKIINPTKEEKQNVRYIAYKTNSVKDEQGFAIACKKEYIIQYFEMKYGLTRKQIIN